MTIRQQGGVFGRNPAFNNVEVENDLTVAGTGQVTGDLGVGKAPAYRLDAIDSSAVVAAISRDGSDGDALQIFNGAGYGTKCLGFGVDGTHGVINNQFGQIQLWTSSAKIATLTVSGLAMENGKGIDFSATAGTGTSELFDDYEEGTWTPAFGNLTLGDGTSTGTYTKIGDTVTIYGKLVLGSTTTVDGTLSVTNLPFSAASGFNPIGNMRLLDQGTNSFAAQVSVNTTSLTFRSAVANSTYLLWGQVNATNPFTWAATDQIEFNAVYKAA